MSTAIALTNASAGRLSAPYPQAKADQLEKASFDVYDAVARDNGGADVAGAAVASIAFQFNPKELTITKAAKWDRQSTKNAKSSGGPQFTGSDPCKLSVEVFFDATSKSTGGVVDAVEQLFACCAPTDKTIGQKKALPPLVMFHWGRTTSFPGFITSVSAKYTLFAPDGTPIRATCSVSMEEMPPGEPKQNPTSGSKSVRRSYLMVAGDSLASVAYAEYGEPAMWRPLAAYNGIDDPLRVPNGTTLLVPAPDELLRSGR